MKRAFLSAASAVAALALAGAPAAAQTNEITIGISVTTTGPAAALGIPERNALDFVPKEIGGVPIKVGNEVIGAVGVSGAPGGEKDEACANAGIAKVADSLK